MPRSWNRNDNDMYQAIKESSMDRGMSPERSEEIAARTVNKHRRQEGRTPNRHTMGTEIPTARWKSTPATNCTTSPGSARSRAAARCPRTN